MVDDLKLLLGILISVGIAVWFMPGGMYGEGFDYRTSGYAVAPPSAPVITDSTSPSAPTAPIVAPRTTAPAPLRAPVAPVAAQITQPTKLSPKALKVSQDVRGTSLTRAEAAVPLLVPITAEELSALPEDIPAFSRPVYSTFRISANGATTAIIQFKVNKSWASPSNIALYRYTDSWTALGTSLLRQDAQYNYFTATSPGLSYFIVSVKSVNKTVVTTVAPPKQPAQYVQEGAPSTPSPYVTQPQTQSPSSVRAPAAVPLGNSIWLVVLLIALVTGGIAIMARHPTPHTTIVTSPELDDALHSIDSAIIEGDRVAANRALAHAERLLSDSSPAVRTTYSSQVQQAYSSVKRLRA